jgi:hypothetical protein
VLRSKRLRRHAPGCEAAQPEGLLLGRLQVLNLLRHVLNQLLELLQLLRDDLENLLNLLELLQLNLLELLNLLNLLRYGLEDLHELRDDLLQLPGSADALQPVRLGREWICHSDASLEKWIQPKWCERIRAEWTDVGPLQSESLRPIAKRSRQSERTHAHVASFL